MFGRVAAPGFAAFPIVALLVALPVPYGIATDARVAATASDAPVAAPHQQIEIQIPSTGETTEATETVEAAKDAKDVVSIPHPAASQSAMPDRVPQPTPARLTALDWTDPAVASRPAMEPFGLDTRTVSGGDILKKWHSVEAAIGAESEILAHCSDSGENCPPAARRFLAIIAQGRARSGKARIGTINRAINLAIEPMSDLAQWGVADRWSAPLETFTTGRGDCEDYAIAKYVALKAAGVAPDDVKLVIVRNTALDEDHAVVTVRLDGAWIVLDNRWLNLVTDSDMRQAIPRFVLDGDGVRQFAPSGLVAARRGAAPASF